MFKNFPVAPLVGAITIACASTTTLAEQSNSQDIVKLDPIVVTATRSAQSLNTVAARVHVIDENTLAQSPIASLPDLLQAESAINMVQLGGYGQQASIFTRGAESDQTLVLRDGVRLNSTTAGIASLGFIDTTDIKQIEILKGPASVLYGTDAIGGVVQLVSKTPEKSGGFLTGEYGENNTYKAIIGADLAENGFYAQVRGQRLETDGTPVTDFKQSNLKTADYDQKGLSAKVGTEQQNYAASIDYNQNQGSSTYVTGDYDPTTYAFVGFKNLSQDFSNEAVNLKGRVNLNENMAIHARASQFQDNIDQNDSTDFVHSTSQEAELYGKWDFTTTQNLLIGATHRNSEADVISYGSPIDESVDTTGYYLQHQFSGQKLNTQVGVRVEDNEKYGEHTVAQGAIRYHFTPATSIYSNIGSAFRAPSINDLYAYGGNPELKPEESVSYEIGLDHQFAPSIQTGISLYRTEIDNLIDSECISDCDDYGYGVYQNQNKDQATMEGGEVYAKWQGKNLYANVAYHYVRAKAKNDETSDDLSRRPRQSASFTAGWADEVYGISSTLTANGKSDNSKYDDVSIPGHLRIDLHAYANVNDHLKLFTNVQNVGDSKYRTAYGSGSYYINGGRLASIGATLRY
ncbi:TonB-dependent receptor plug domain-containing protein [Acinetobacter sp.]|uniref:TonB-dependent receptor plug domain-containing protein n=1 Tax=Acinetobacter sp. TaxID=472 RepID=UPI0035AF807E